MVNEQRIIPRNFAGLLPLLCTTQNRVRLGGRAEPTLFPFPSLAAQNRISHRSGKRWDGLMLCKLLHCPLSLLHLSRRCHSHHAVSQQSSGLFLANLRLSCLILQQLKYTVPLFWCLQNQANNKQLCKIT